MVQQLLIQHWENVTHIDTTLPKYDTNILNVSGGLYKIGDNIDIVANFTENIYITNTANAIIRLNANSQTKNATYLSGDTYIRNYI